MRRLLLSCLAIFSLAACQRPSASNSEPEDISHFVEEIDPPAEASIVFASPALSQQALNPTAGLVAVEKIVNTGEKIWNIIEKNRASTEATVTFANAIPKGIGEGSEMEGFSELQQRSYRAYGKNLYGVTVYDVEYTLVHRYGGTHGGAGRYLDHVAVVPSNITALWGYTVDVSVAASAPTNLGTKSNPVAAMVVQVKLAVSTVLKSAQSTRAFEFRGDSFSAAEVGKSSALAEAGR